MKRWGTILAAVALCFMLALPARAEEDFAQGLEQRLGADHLGDHLEEEPRTLLEQAGVYGPEDAENGPQLLQVLSESLRGKLLGPLKALGALVALAVLCRLADALAGERIKASVSFAGTLAASAVVLTPLLQVMGQARRTVQAAGVFLAGAVPVYGGLLVASGSPGAGTAYLTWALGLANFLPLAAEGFLFPMMQVFLMLAAASAASELGLDGLAKSVFSAARWVLVLGVTVFSGVLSLQTLLGAQGDAAAGKTMRFLAASAVPVVGGAMGDGVAALQSSISVLRSGVGAFGLLAAVALFAPTALEAVAWAALCRAGRVVGEWFSERRLARLMELCADGAGMILAVLASVFVALTVCAGILLAVRGSLA